MTYKLTFEKKDGKLTEKSKQDIVSQVAVLDDGLHSMVIEPKSNGYTNTRYKYYFGHLLQVILLTCGDRFQVLDGDNFRPVRDTTEIHDALKLRYNPVIIRTEWGVSTLPSSTTSLSDRDFIAKFEQDITAEFSGPPFNCDFMSREEYGRHMANKHH